MNVQELIRVKRLGKKKWVVLTAYDAPTVEILENAGVDWVLVGDSLGMVVLGYPSTACVTMDEMIHHAKAVCRGAQKTFVIGDMPFEAVTQGVAFALKSAKRFLKEAECDAVKLEWNPDALRITRELVRNKISVMGHVGLTPQTAKKRGDFKVRGRDAGSAIEIYEAARAFEQEGAFSVVLECVPLPVAKYITGSLRVPTIGIGSGPHCDGQVLVFHDVVGLFKKFRPRFVKRYARADLLIERAVKKYAEEVRSGKFPLEKHSFKMSRQEFFQLQNLIRKERL